jgi:hypothetical protein
MIRFVHSGSWIRIQTFYPSRFQGLKRHRIPDSDPQCINVVTRDTRRHSWRRSRWQSCWPRSRPTAASTSSTSCWKLPRPATWSSYARLSASIPTLSTAATWTAATLRLSILLQVSLPAALFVLYLPAVQWWRCVCFIATIVYSLVD